MNAHQALDRAVDAAYIAAERVAFLFERYQALTSLMPAAKPKRAVRRKPVAHAE